MRKIILLFVFVVCVSCSKDSDLIPCEEVRVYYTKGEPLDTYKGEIGYETLPSGEVVRYVALKKCEL